MKAQEMLELLERGGQQLQKEVPEHMEKFWSFAEKVKEEGNLSKREKALIAVATVAAKHCEVCIVRNLKDAIETGITKEELAELCTIIMLVDGGPGFAHCTFLLEKYDELIEEQE